MSIQFNKKIPYISDIISLIDISIKISFKLIKKQEIYKMILVFHTISFKKFKLKYLLN